jgi:pimeloyl-ACP methyl ester carboxylesterase
MAALTAILGEQTGWTLVGSSFGGLMAALFAVQRPAQARRLVLLAPALIWPDFASRYAAPPGEAAAPLEVPTLIYHGCRDEIIPLAAVRPLAQRAFHNLDFREVDDDHGLHKTVHELDWRTILT